MEMQRATKPEEHVQNGCQFQFVTLLVKFAISRRSRHQWTLKWSNAGLAEMLPDCVCADCFFLNWIE